MQGLKGSKSIPLRITDKLAMNYPADLDQFVVIIQFYFYNYNYLYSYINNFCCRYIQTKSITMCNQLLLQPPAHILPTPVKASGVARWRWQVMEDW